MIEPLVKRDIDDPVFRLLSMASDGFTKSHPALPYYRQAVCSHRDAMAALHDINGLVREWTPFPAPRENDAPQTEHYSR